MKLQTHDLINFLEKNVFIMVMLLVRNQNVLLS